MAVSHLHTGGERPGTHYVFLNQPSATGVILLKTKKKYMTLLFQRRNIHTVIHNHSLHMQYLADTYTFILAF